MLWKVGELLFELQSFHSVWLIFNAIAEAVYF